MVQQYLINSKQELIEKKIDLIQSLHKIELKMKENKEFIRLIDNSQDKVYDSFSPHNSNRNNTNSIKRKGLKREFEKLQESQERIKKEINEIEQKMTDLDSMIHYLKIVERNKIENQKIENQNIEKKKELEEEQQKFHYRLLNHFELEQKSIASEIFELNMEAVSSVIHKIEMCSKFVDVDIKRCKLELQNISKDMKSLSKDMKKLSFHIHPIPGDDMDSVLKLFLIEKEIERFRRKNEIEVHYKKEGDYTNLSEIVELTMFRILKECLKNVKKHANAKNVYISISERNEIVQLEIEDDGCGFDLKKVSESRESCTTGSGLEMIYDRIQLLAGKISVDTKKGKGTKIYITLPL